MRTLPLLALVALAATCGPSPDAKLPAYLLGSGGATTAGAGGLTSPDVALGGSAGEGSGGENSGTGGVTSMGGSMGGAKDASMGDAKDVSMGEVGGRPGSGGVSGRGGVTSLGGTLGRGGTTTTRTTALPTCTDRLKNQDETDIDCGGAICVTRCALGLRCLVDTDCVTATPPLVCDTTTKKCTDPCKNQKKDGDETGVDCGGGCPLKCTGERCTSNADCQSADCDTAKGTCRAPSHPLANIKQTCWDGITGYNPSDKTVAMSSIVPCMTSNGCCKLPVSNCTETCFTSNDGTCGVNKTGGGMAPHNFVLAYYQKCVP